MWENDLRLYKYVYRYNVYIVLSSIARTITVALLKRVILKHDINEFKVHVIEDGAYSEADPG